MTPEKIKEIEDRLKLSNLDSFMDHARNDICELLDFLDEVCIALQSACHEIDNSNKLIKSMGEAMLEAMEKIEELKKR